MKVCIVQYDIHWLGIEANIAAVTKVVESADESVDLYILPEMCLTGFCMDAGSAAVLEDGPEIGSLVSLCHRYSTRIIGSFAIKEEGRYYNRSLLIDGSGICHRYDKEYRFSPSGEDANYESRYPLTYATIDGWTIAPQICYDLRFPEAIRAHHAPDVLLYMANWPSPRVSHWKAMLTARAIENQCYVIGVNRIGRDGNDWGYPGRSMLVKPDGRSVVFGGQEDSLTLPLDRASLIDYRERYPFLQDRKGVSRVS